MQKSIHEGHNIKRFREMLGLKQEALAMELGEAWNQKKVSLLESKEKIEPGLLDQVAGILKITPDAIRNFNEDTAIQIISNTFNSNDSSTLNAINPNCTFNPVEKMVQLYEEKIALLERLIKDKEETISRLEKRDKK